MHIKSERFIKSADYKYNPRTVRTLHVCHLCHSSTASRRRGPPHFSMRSQPMQQAAFRIESSGCTLAGVAPGRKPYCGDRTSCTPSHGHGPRHSAWEGCRTIHLGQELSLRGCITALGLPRLLIARPPSRPKSPVSSSPQSATRTWVMIKTVLVTCSIQPRRRWLFWLPLVFYLVGVDHDSSASQHDT